MRGKFNVEAINFETMEMLVNQGWTNILVPQGWYCCTRKWKKKILQWIMMINGLSSQKKKKKTQKQG